MQSERVHSPALDVAGDASVCSMVETRPPLRLPSRGRRFSLFLDWQRDRDSRLILRLVKAIVVLGSHILSWRLFLLLYYVRVLLRRNKMGIPQALALDGVSVPFGFDQTSSENYEEISCSIKIRRIGHTFSVYDTHTSADSRSAPTCVL